MTLKAKPEGKGKFSFSLELREARVKSVVRTVLSEGEQRAIALASFLADVTGTERPTPVIFDDPISSLDQDFEERVAGRLVELGRARQVIIFTHRLSLVALINEAASNAKGHGHPISVAVQEISRTAQGAGAPSLWNVFNQKPMPAMNDLLQAIKGLGNVPAALEPMARVGLCTAFRQILERIVEFHLLADLVMRYRRDITTKKKSLSSR